MPAEQRRWNPVLRVHVFMRETLRFEETVLVEDIPPEGLHRVYADLTGLLSGVEDFRPKGPVHGEARLWRTDGGVYLQAEVRALVVLSCHRCLEDFDRQVDATFAYVFLPEGSEGLEDSSALKAEDMEASVFNGREVPIGEAFREQLLLQLPMKSLCQESCRGLCPGCGVNLNIESCQCGPGSTGGPFAALKVLK